jgi:hypothetical protein
MMDWKEKANDMTNKDILISKQSRKVKHCLTFYSQASK